MPGLEQSMCAESRIPEPKDPQLSRKTSPGESRPVQDGASSPPCSSRSPSTAQGITKARHPGGCGLGEWMV
jgi:hypothetical protein